MAKLKKFNLIFRILKQNRCKVRGIALSSYYLTVENLPFPFLSLPALSLPYIFDEH